MQHRKVYIDDWCLMERVCLASAVLRYGENNWSSVCELLKPKLQENRPWDWFTPETCEAQYKVLCNELVKQQIDGESAVLQIIQNLKTQCKLEGQRKEERWNKYMAVKKKLENLLKNDVESELIEKYYEEIQLEKKEREENLRQHQEALKKREVLKHEFEKASPNATVTPNKQETKADGSSSPLVTSPLLSSLLNNPPAVQYRPTLSTSSFIPTKASQGTSRSSSFEKVQSYDSSFKDSFTQELSDQLTTSERQLTPVASSSSVVIKNLDFSETISTSMASRTFISESNTSRIQPMATETTPRSDHQNLDNLGLISPNEVDLSEVDPEAILEVIGGIKDGQISIDKLIQDLEASDEGVMMDKEDLASVSVSMNQSYIIDNKPIEQVPLVTHPQSIVQLSEDIKPVISNECKLVMKEIEVEPPNAQLSEPEKLLDVEEQVVMMEDPDKEDQDVRISETDDIANIEINSSDGNIEIPMVKDESPVSSLSFSSTVAISVELESSFSEQKSDSETAEQQTTKSTSIKSSESEQEEDTKIKYSKPVVVIKRIEDSSFYLNKNRRNKNKIILEETLKEEPPAEPEPTLDQVKEPDQMTEIEPEIPTVEQTNVQPEETIPDNHKEAEQLMETVDENVTIEEDTESNNDNESTQIQEPVEKPAPPFIADDSDTSDKFEDALQTQTDETIANQTEDNIANVEIEEKSSSYAEVDESFDSNVSEGKAAESTIVEETSQQFEQEPNPEEVPIEEKSLDSTIIELEKVEPNENESLENVSTIESKVEDVSEKEVTPPADEVDDISEKAIDEVKQPEEVRPVPTKIIKKYGRKRKNTTESNDSITEMTINIAPVMLQEIETLDSDNEQRFAPVCNIKLEPTDSKPPEEKKENEKTVSIEKPRTRENTPAKIKQERIDNRTPERQVVKVLRRNTGKTQSPLRKTDRESRSMDNSELIKTRRKSILFAYSRLVSHKYSNAFQKPITSRQVPGYEDIIYKPMDLYTIKKKIDNKQINSVAEFQREVLLMLNNAKMFNRINSQVYNMAVEVEEDALPHIQLTVQTLGEGVLRQVVQSNEKIRKRQSLDNKKDVKLKRLKSSTKDDSFSGLPLKKPKLEENDDD